MAQLRPLLQSFFASPDLPSHESLLSLLEGGISVLENENESYRPRDDEGRAGGLLDFLRADFLDLPVIVVPDLHGRGKFVLDLLDFSLEGRSVLSLLEAGEVIICCVGDIFHSEMRGRVRWKKAFEEFSRGMVVNDALCAEMRENLSLLEMILTLKSAFASHFHVLKGNHENVLNEDSRRPYGNVPFRKFCDEGNMVAEFLQSQYDDLILHEISCFEKSLPVCAVFKDCVVSHAEPFSFYSRSDIINYHKPSSDVVFGLTWTANDKAREGSVAHLLAELLPPSSAERAVYFSGHRPVLGKYALRQGGRLVQIHNPEIEQVAVVRSQKRFDPDCDIIDVEKR